MKIKSIMSIIFLFALISFTAPIFNAHAGTYSYYLGRFEDYSDGTYIRSTEAIAYPVFGYNASQGFLRQLNCNVTKVYYNRYNKDYYLNYDLPDDGSAWIIDGVVSFYQKYIFNGGPELGYSESSHQFSIKVSDSKTTSGTFTGYSPKTATDAANAAASNASTAAINATNAYNAANDAKNAANSANANAASAADRTWDTVTSKSAATLAREARDKAASADTKLDAIQTSITNIQNNLGADVTPPVVKIRTVSGALATSGGSISAVLDISDNAGSDFTYSLDGTSYTPVPADGKVFLPLGSPGPNVVTVWVKDGAGNAGRSSITIRRL
ncbi:MAG: hypothetical protein K6T66_14540 [Peptococcaceae bacterium]|nr:hypothetical protein [Peptococcaceae bacterium]